MLSLSQALLKTDDAGRELQQLKQLRKQICELEQKLRVERAVRAVSNDSWEQLVSRRGDWLAHQAALRIQNFLKKSNASDDILRDCEVVLGFLTPAADGVRRRQPRDAAQQRDQAIGILNSSISSDGTGRWSDTTLSSKSSCAGGPAAARHCGPVKSLPRLLTHLQGPPPHHHSLQASQGPEALSLGDWGSAGRASLTQSWDSPNNNSLADSLTHLWPGCRDSGDARPADACGRPPREHQQYISGSKDSNDGSHATAAGSDASARAHASSSGGGSTSAGGAYAGSSAGGSFSDGRGSGASNMSGVEASLGSWSALPRGLYPYLPAPGPVAAIGSEASCPRGTGPAQGPPWLHPHTGGSRVDSNTTPSTAQHQDQPGSRGRSVGRQRPGLPLPPARSPQAEKANASRNPAQPQPQGDGGNNGARHLGQRLQPCPHRAADTDSSAARPQPDPPSATVHNHLPWDRPGSSAGTDRTGDTESPLRGKRAGTVWCRTGPSAPAPAAAAADWLAYDNPAYETDSQREGACWSGGRRHCTSADQPRGLQAGCTAAAGGDDAWAVVQAAQQAQQYLPAPGGAADPHQLSEGHAAKQPIAGPRAGEQETIIAAQGRTSDARPGASAHQHPSPPQPLWRLSAPSSRMSVAAGDDGEDWSPAMRRATAAADAAAAAVSSAALALGWAYSPGAPIQVQAPTDPSAAAAAMAAAAANMQQTTSLGQVALPWHCPGFGELRVSSGGSGALGRGSPRPDLSFLLLSSAAASRASLAGAGASDGGASFGSRLSTWGGLVPAQTAGELMPPSPYAGLGAAATAAAAAVAAAASAAARLGPTSGGDAGRGPSLEWGSGGGGGGKWMGTAALEHGALTEALTHGPADDSGAPAEQDPPAAGDTSCVFGNHRRQPQDKDTAGGTVPHDADACQGRASEPARDAVGTTGVRGVSDPERSRDNDPVQAPALATGLRASPARLTARLAIAEPQTSSAMPAAATAQPTGSATGHDGSALSCCVNIGTMDTTATANTAGSLAGAHRTEHSVAASPTNSNSSTGSIRPQHTAGAGAVPGPSAAASAATAAFEGCRPESTPCWGGGTSGVAQGQGWGGAQPAGYGRWLGAGEGPDHRSASPQRVLPCSSRIPPPPIQSPHAGQDEHLLGQERQQQQPRPGRIRANRLGGGRKGSSAAARAGRGSEGGSGASGGGAVAAGGAYAGARLGGAVRRVDVGAGRRQATGGAMQGDGERAGALPVQQQVRRKPAARYFHSRLVTAARGGGGGGGAEGRVAAEQGTTRAVADAAPLVAGARELSAHHLSGALPAGPPAAGLQAWPQQGTGSPHRTAPDRSKAGAMQPGGLLDASDCAVLRRSPQSVGTNGAARAGDPATGGATAVSRSPGPHAAGLAELPSLALITDMFTASPAGTGNGSMGSAILPAGANVTATTAGALAAVGGRSYRYSEDSVDGGSLVERGTSAWSGSGTMEPGVSCSISSVGWARLRKDADRVVNVLMTPPPLAPQAPPHLGTHAAAPLPPSTETESHAAAGPSGSVASSGATRGELGARRGAERGAAAGVGAGWQMVHEDGAIEDWDRRTQREVRRAEGGCAAASGLLDAAAAGLGHDESSMADIVQGVSGSADATDGAQHGATGAQATTVQGGETAGGADPSATAADAVVHSPTTAQALASLLFSLSPGSSAEPLQTITDPNSSGGGARAGARSGPAGGASAFAANASQSFSAFSAFGSPQSPERQGHDSAIGQAAAAPTASNGWGSSAAAFGGSVPLAASGGWCSPEADWRGAADSLGFMPYASMRSDGLRALLEDGGSTSPTEASQAATPNVPHATRRRQTDSGACGGPSPRLREQMGVASGRPLAAAPATPTGASSRGGGAGALGGGGNAVDVGDLGTPVAAIRRRSWFGSAWQAAVAAARSPSPSPSPHPGARNPAAESPSPSPGASPFSPGSQLTSPAPAPAGTSAGPSTALHAAASILRGIAASVAAVRSRRASELGEMMALMSGSQAGMAASPDVGSAVLEAPWDSGSPPASSPRNTVHSPSSVGGAESGGAERERMTS